MSIHQNILSNTKDNITACIIADSINPVGDRLTTFILEFPRFILAELNTHRCLSKNASSSRAIPFEKLLTQVKNTPAAPVFWGKNQPGMQAVEELDATQTIETLIPTFWARDTAPDVIKAVGTGDDLLVHTTERTRAKLTWLAARDAACFYAAQLHKQGVHKQICNRIIEPWVTIRVILSGTDFENFFALRAHKDAQPEFQELAFKMLAEMNKSVPNELQTGEWHIPFGDNIDDVRLEVLAANIAKAEGIDYDEAVTTTRQKIAIARCARVSYLNFNGKDDYAADVDLCNKLFASTPKHLSPTEHVACALSTSVRSGNFTGFKQFRKFQEHENLTDSRLKKYKK